MTARVALEDWPETWETPETEEARRSWRIEHPGQLDWVMRRLRDARLRQVEVETRAQAEIDRIREWADRQRARYERDVVWFGSLAQEYALKERARDEDRKTLETPYGRVCTRQGQPTWDIDADVLLPWLREHHRDLVKVTPAVESVDKAALKRAFSKAVEGGSVFDPATGDPVPGVKVEEPTVTASVDLDLGLHADDEAPR